MLIGKMGQEVCDNSLCYTCKFSVSQTTLKLEVHFKGKKVSGLGIDVTRFGSIKR
jgi:hypothetical protein